jgi:hypothetical protein
MRKREFQRALLSIFFLVLAMGSRTHAGFSSIYGFGDGVCTTTANLTPASLYYSETTTSPRRRYCNGRVWIEVLAQWQGLPYNYAQNQSFYGHDSATLLTTTNSFPYVADAASALFIVWCCNADFVEHTSANPPSPTYTNANIPAWTSFINQSVSRHVQAVNNLYVKGARTLLMPNAVNIAAVPYFNFGGANKEFIRARAAEFNVAFRNAMLERMASLPGLTIHLPDTYTLFEQVLAAPGEFGLFNGGAAVLLQGVNYGNGIGANYVFWDYWHPSAKFQMLLADQAQQLISPPKVTGITVSGGNAQLQIANTPMGRTGHIQGSSNLQPPWTGDGTFVLPFTAWGSTTASASVPASASQRFYRVHFPVVWTWP